jgi:hypothetical protein
MRIVVYQELGVEEQKSKKLCVPRKGKKSGACGILKLHVAWGSKQKLLAPNQQ